MRRIIIGIVLLSFLSLAGCRKGGTLTAVGEVVFPLGFTTTAAEQCFEYGGEEYMAFANLSSNKEVSLFRPDGRKVLSVDIRPLIEKTKTNYVTFFFAAPDTLLLLSRYSNLVAAVDSNGNPLFVWDFQKLLFKNAVELAPPLYYLAGNLRVGTLFSSYKAYYTLGLRDSNLDKECDVGWYYRPHIMTCSHLPNGEIEFQADSLYPRFAGSDKDVTEFNRMLCLDTMNIVWSTYCDSLYLYDLSGKLKKVVGIHSDHIAARLTPPTHVASSKNLDLRSEIAREGSFIRSLLYDKYRQLYFCFVVGKTFEGKHDFYVIVLDKNLKKIDEIPFVDRMYYSSAFVGRQGLYVKQAQKNNFRNCTFTIFRYEK